MGAVANDYACPLAGFIADSDGLHLAERRQRHKDSDDAMNEPARKMHCSESRLA